MKSKTQFAAPGSEPGLPWSRSFFMWSRSRNLKAAPPKQVKQIEKNLTLCKPQTKLFLNSKFVDAKFISGAGARAEQISSVE